MIYIDILIYRKSILKYLLSGLNTLVEHIIRFVSKGTRCIIWREDPCNCTNTKIRRRLRVYLLEIAVSIARYNSGAFSAANYSFVKLIKILSILYIGLWLEYENHLLHF